MTSANGNIFRVTGPLCGEFSGHGEFPSQRPVTRSFDVFFDLRLDKRLSKQSRRQWFEMPLGSLWRHGYEFMKFCVCHSVMTLIHDLVNQQKILTTHQLNTITPLEKFDIESAKMSFISVKRYYWNPMHRNYRQCTPEGITGSSFKCQYFHVAGL